MPRASIVVAAAALVVAACSDSSVVEPTAASPGRSLARTSSASPSRPAGGTCTFESTPLPPVQGQPPNVVRFSVEGVCHLRHLGLTTAVAEEIATLTPGGSAAVWTTTYTAANGDQLFTTSSTTGPLPDQSGVVQFSGTETVTGGTGRFADASGALSLTGSVSVVTHTGQIELDGTLSY